MLPILSNKLPDFHHASLLVVGDVMLDRYFFGNTDRISPEAPVPVVKIHSTDNRPGGAGNVALNIAALGARVVLLGITGDDEAANLLAEQLSAAQVHHHFCRNKALSTLMKLRVISQRQQLLRMDFEDKLLSSENNDLLNQFQAHLHQAQLVILSDYHKGTLANPQAFIQLAREANVPVLVDPKGKDFSIYRGATIITPNLKEFEAVVGTCKSEHELIEKGRALLAQFQIENLLVTRGERGLTLIQPQETAHFPARAREVLDVTGAGDTVISALGAAVAAKLPLAHAAALANLAASIAVGKLGAVSVSAPELQAALNKNAGFTTGIINEEQLLEAVNQARIEGKKIVMTNGCFDILHAGHVVCLQLAKQMGDYLIVAVNTDESIQKLKGPSRPINHLNHRMTVLAGLNVVDWVVPFADDTPERLLRLLQPDVLVKGGDYQLHEVVGADIVRAYGGEVRVVDSQITSSSHIIKRIMTVHSLDDEKENRQHG